MAKSWMILWVFWYALWTHEVDSGPYVNKNVSRTTQRGPKFVNSGLNYINQRPKNINKGPNYINKNRNKIPWSSIDSCPKSCVCQNKRAYCDALSLTHMPHRLPYDLEALLMRNNLIRRINQRHFSRLYNLKHLILKGNRIHRIDPNSMRSLRSLVSLSFTENNIRQLEPGTFRSLGELRFLSLRKNKLKDVEELFSRLYKLQLLNVANNRLKMITQKTFQSNWRLVILDIHDNRIKHIHKYAFKSMPLIKYLVLRDNPLHTLEINFKPNIHLELLDFTNCKLTEMVQGLPYSINDLRLSENDITQITAKDFKNTRKIRLLVLTSNKIENIDDEAFSRMLHLYDLYIGGNALNKLPVNLPHNLHGIFANGNNLTDIQVEPLIGIHSLEFLYLRSNKIHDVLQEALWSLGNLRCLDISNNQIGDLKSMTFRGNKFLQRLDISRNPLLELDKDSFVGLDNLHIFEMSSVGSRYDISRINPNIFKDMKALLFLDLSNSSQIVQGIADHPNSLAYMSSIEDLNLMEDNLVALPPNFPNHFPHLRLIKLIGNPWHCDMDILWMAYWMRNKTVEFFAPYHMVCKTPPELNGHLIMDLTESDLMPVTKRKPYIKYIEISLQEYSGTDGDDIIDITRYPLQYTDNDTVRQTIPPNNGNYTVPKYNQTYTTRIIPGTMERDENSDLIARYIIPDRKTKAFMQTYKTVAPNFFDYDNKTLALNLRKQKQKKKKMERKMRRKKKMMEKRYRRKKDDGEERSNYNFTKWKDKSDGIIPLEDSYN